MKKLKKIVITFLSLTSLFVLVDLYVFRSYYLPTFLNNLYDWETSSQEIESEDLSIEITKENNLYEINFKNTSIKAFLVWTYRYDQLLFKMNDSIFRYRYRLKVNTPHFKNDYEYGLDCGTGAGSFSINPYESFSSKVTRQELLDPYYWGAYHQNNKNGDTINDLIYNKPLLIVNHRENTFEVIKRKDITEKDSIDAQLFLPFFSYNHQKLSYAKSNYIKLSYPKIIERMILEKSKVFKKLNN
ncbi:hypothetical protein [Tenacibaculum agarivorans]|uniref:hypothetical protein n=1 Tax=Tenacibaculum agarivorans TaxID=1908389 RepID=UPI00094B935A|nr:hypothetical protein [Tenacibaculum agarivorans]